MFQSKLPTQYWGDAITTTSYLINKTLSPTIGNHTPYFRLFGHQPDYLNLKVFGSLCYVKDKSHKMKFQSRSIKGVLLGYSTKSKDYKILNLDTNSVFINRDVCFYEIALPFKNSSYITSSKPNLDNYEHTPRDALVPETDTTTPISCSMSQH